MPFPLTKSQGDIHKAAGEFAKGAFDKELVLEKEKEADFPEVVRQKAAELGFLGIGYPEGDDGGGLGVVENALVAEAFCQRDSSMGIALMLSGFSAECLLLSGRDEFSSPWLSRIANGEALAGGAFAEHGVGWDPEGIAATAREEAGEWLISGRKVHVPNGGAAGFYCVLCRTEEGDGLSKDPSLILVEGDRAGVSVEKSRDALGMRMTRPVDLCFHEVRVPLENRISQKGRGHQDLMGFYEEAWIMAAAMALGTARGALGRAVDHVKRRKQFGRTLARFQAIRHKIADMAAQTEEAAACVYRTAGRFDQGERSPAAAAMTKLSACSKALSVTSEAVQLLGGYGYMREFEVERFYRDARALAVFCGNAGFLRDVAAGSVMGRIK
jgi:alkylation response protein AidB-like acyl-CoA dehydrogenase